MVLLGSLTLNSITEPKNMFITDIRNRRERPDISVPEKKNELNLATFRLIKPCFIRGGEISLKGQ